MLHLHQHNPEKYYLTVPFAEFPRRFGTRLHPSPRHLTLVPWFRCSSRNTQELLSALQEFCSVQSPFDITFNAVQGFGGSGEIEAQAVKSGREDIIKLHCGLLAVVSAFATIIDSSYVADGYSPHSSVEAHGVFSEDQLVNVRSVLVVGKYVKNEHCINDSDKEHSAGFRLGPKPSTSDDLVVG